MFQERRLKVWLVDTKGTPHPVGELRVTPEGIAFRYTSYGFIIDPINLPYTPEEIKTQEIEKPLLVFDDTIPDTWGLKVLSKKYNFNFGKCRHMALGFGDSSRIGAILYSDPEDKRPPRPTWVNFQALKKSLEKVSSFDVKIIEQALDFLGISEVNIGGAKPKTTLVDFQNRPWLVKFPANNDPNPTVVARVEVEGLSFARDIGLEVPLFWLVKTGNIFSIAVKRFDITSLKLPYLGRQMVISLSTMMGGLEMFDEGYEKAAHLIKNISSYPKRDVYSFFKQMVLNWFIVNTDDHLKNFSFLWNGRTIRLSPAYDLVGNLWGMAEHTMPINDKNKDITPDDLIKAGSQMGIPSHIAKEEINYMAERAAIYYERLLGIEGAEMLAERVEERLSFFEKKIFVKNNFPESSDPSQENPQGL